MTDLPWVVLVNPTAGGGRGAKWGRRVVEAVSRSGAGVRVVIGTDASDAERRAVSVVGLGARGLLTVGGDGAAHIGINVAAKAGVPFGVVAAGSGNDFARALGTRTLGPEDAVASILQSEVNGGVAVDLGKLASGRYFGCVLSAGFDAAVNAKANTMRHLGGRSRYPLAMLSQLRVFRPMDLVVDVDGTRHRHRSMLVAVGNSSSYGGGMRICPSASMTDGQFQVTIVEEMSVVELLSLFPRVYRGTHVNHPKATVYAGRRVRVYPELASGGSDQANLGLVFADGEQVGAGSITATVSRAALRVLTHSLP
ncbi:MAG: diacylglycerol kinase family protein [Actinomycetes bacterium]